MSIDKLRESVDDLIASMEPDELINDLAQLGIEVVDIKDE